MNRSLLMIGLGTLYNNALGVCWWARTAHWSTFIRRFQLRPFWKWQGCCFCLGYHPGTLEKMLVVYGSHVESHGSMMLILSLVIRTRYRGTLEDWGGLWATGAWLKERATKAIPALLMSLDHGLDRCIGAMAVVGAVRMACSGDTSTLLAKGDSGYGYRSGLDRLRKEFLIFAVVPLWSFRDWSLLAHLIAPICWLSPFRSVTSRLQPHSLCSQSHLGLGSKVIQSTSSSADCHYWAVGWKIEMLQI